MPQEPSSVPRLDEKLILENQQQQPKVFKQWQPKQISVTPLTKELRSRLKHLHQRLCKGCLRFHYIHPTTWRTVSLCSFYNYHLRSTPSKFQPFNNVPTSFKQRFLVNLLYLLSSCYSLAISISVKVGLLSTKTCAKVRPSMLSCKAACVYSMPIFFVTIWNEIRSSWRVEPMYSVSLMQDLVSIMSPSLSLHY